MTDQKDPFNADEQQDEKIPAEEPLSPAPEEEGKATDAVEDIAGRGVAAGEVRAVESPPKQKSSVPLVAVLIVLLILFAGGYYLLSGGGVLPLTDSGQDVAEPKRYAIDKNVTVEVVEQKQVAAVGVIAQPVMKTAAVKQEKESLPVEKKTAAPAVAEQKIEPVAAAGPQYQVLVGPFLQTAMLEAARQQLKQLGLQAEEGGRGRGPVAMTRLLEGVYQREEGRERVKLIKKQLGDAFLLPTGDKLALYVGSFTEPQRAQQYADQLAEKGVAVTPVTSDVVMNGRMLIAMQGEQKAARQIAAKVAAVGLSAQLKKQ